MRVTKVTVENLFGIFNHIIEFKLSERITIIHGPNGFGKTIILKMISGLLSSSYGIFHSVPFNSFTMSFDDGSSIEISKESQLSLPKIDSSTSPSQKYPRKPKAEKRLSKLNGKYSSSTGASETIKLLNTKELPERLKRSIDQLLPNNLRMVVNGWVDLQTDTFYSHEDVIKIYGPYLRAQAPDLMEQLGANEKSPLARIQSDIHCHFIATERLQRDRSVSDRRPHSAYYPPDIQSSDSSPTVERYSNEIVSLIAGVLAQYAGRASELDRTFPERLVYQKDQYAPNTANLKVRFKAIESQRSLLISLGFLDPEKGGLSEIPESLYDSAGHVLAVYVNDTEEKLGTFNEMAKKIELFTKIVNSRFSYKKLRISREKGFIFESKLGELSPTNLSSGEQHELVLLYELLFKVDKTWLVMLDEPEISLHVGWQEQFLDDLQEIVKLSNVDVLIATHSPIIIGGHWDDLTVPLMGPGETVDA